MKPVAIVAAAVATVGFIALFGFAAGSVDRDAESKKAKDFCAQFYLKEDAADNCVFAKYNELHSDQELKEIFGR